MKKYVPLIELLESTLKHGQLDESTARMLKEEIEVYKIMDKDENLPYKVCDTGALNEVIRGYVLLALGGGADAMETAGRNLNYIFDTYNAKEAEAYSKKRMG